MLLHQSGFVTICPKKELDLHTADHRADHAAELKAEVSVELKGATGNEYAFLPGGAVRAINPNSSMTLAQEGECIAVFKGNLHNKAELALGLVGCPSHVTEAQLLLQLYAACGLDMLRRLNGQYAFCLYDSKQARVLAARDHSGAVPLMEGRTAAGSLIIACGTFLPEGVTQVVDIGPGEYKYGWHALPRAFQCGAGKIVAGRASCDYGIRRRSIDAYNAPARPSVGRSMSLDIQPSGRSHQQHGSPSTSHSLPHTPGRYMPPHLQAAAAVHASGHGGEASGWAGRQRATSCDGSHPVPTPPRRRSETNTQHHGSHHQGLSAQLQRRHSGGQQQLWAPKSPLVVTPPSPSAAAATPAATVSPAVTPKAAPGSAATDEASTPKSGEHHRRKRRHHRRSRKHNNTAEGAAADEAHSSDTESQVSTSTLDSASSGALTPATTAAAATAGKQAGGRRSSKDGSARPVDAAAPSKPGARHEQQRKTSEHQPLQQQQQQQQSSNGGSSFKRNGSCSELAVLGSSPTAAHSALLAGPQQGLAC